MLTFNHHGALDSISSFSWGHSHPPRLIFIDEGLLSGCPLLYCKEEEYILKKGEILKEKKKEKKLKK
jgi:hypothetical protein